MRSLRVLFIGFLITLPSLSFSQHLLINEVSQGLSGAKEYVEFVVPGSPSCSGVPTKDLRRMIIDDNNGLFQPGSGSGIAPGAIRFANTSFWAAIPQGTIIVVYNESDRGATIPPDDASMADGNQRLILPADSPLLEGQGTSPTNSVNTYPTSDASWIAGAGQWSYLGMANGGDSFQVRQTATATVPYSSVSWGTNNANTTVYFSGSASGQVYYCNDAPLTNWASGPAASSQTPGAANNAANAAFILSFTTGSTGSLQVAMTVVNESCNATCNGSITAQVTGGTAPFTYTWQDVSETDAVNDNLCPGTYTLTVTDNTGCTGNSQATVNASATLNVSLNKTDESCADACDGTIASTVTGGQTPLSYSWSNGNAGSSISGLCPDTYTLSVTDVNGCSGNAASTINAGVSAGSATITTAGPFQTTDASVQLTAAANGGVWATADCSDCLTPSGIFSPAIAGAGTFQICYTLSNGSCSANDCENFIVEEGCTPEQTAETVYICEGDSSLVFGNWETEQDLFSQTFTNTGGCDSTHRVTLMYYSVQNTDLSIGLCADDSVLVFGNWVDSAGIYTRELQNGNGCSYTETVTVYDSECGAELSVFVPNAFTPNGDYTNDIFKIEILGATVEEGYIFNRWGNEIKRFSINDLEWDGKNIQNLEVPEGVYTYMIRYSVANGNAEVIHGHVTLIR